MLIRRGCVTKETIHINIALAECGLEQLESTMQVTGSCPEQKSHNCAHKNNIKAIIIQIRYVGIPSDLCALMRALFPEAGRSFLKQQYRLCYVV